MELKKYRINFKIKLDKEVEIDAYNANQAVEFLKNQAEEISDFLEISTPLFDKKSYQYKVLGIEKVEKNIPNKCENCEYFCIENESCIFPNARL